VAAANRGPTAPLWLATGICLGLLAYCVIYEYWVGAIAAAAALAATLVGTWAYRAGAAAGKPVGPIGGPYGNGPYRQIECGPTRQVVDTLADIAGKLRELPEKQPGNWQVDWQSYDATRAQATAAAEAGRTADAIRHLCHAIRDILRQLRNHRPTLEDGSEDDPTP